MQSLKLAPKEFRELRLTKSATIREGRKDVKLGLLEFENTESGAVEVANILSVQYCQLLHVSLEDLAKDNMVNPAHAVMKLIEYYPDITLNSEITVIKFEIV